MNKFKKNILFSVFAILFVLCLPSMAFSQNNNPVLEIDDFFFSIKTDKIVYAVGDMAQISVENNMPKEISIISAQIALPDGSIRAMIFPKIIEIQQIGEYKITVQLELSGESIKKEYSFKAIESHIQAKQITRECELDNSCDKESKIESSKLLSLQNILITLAILLILAAAIASFLYFRSKKDTYGNNS